MSPVHAAKLALYHPHNANIIGVPLKKTLSLLTPLFSEPIIKFYEYVLRSTYFSFQGVYYTQVEGVVMGSYVSPITADFFMEDFEAKELELAPLKPLLTQGEC